MCGQKKPGPKRDETTAGHAGSVGTGGGGGGGGGGAAQPFSQCHSTLH